MKNILTIIICAICSTLVAQDRYKQYTYDLVSYTTGFSYFVGTVVVDRHSETQLVLLGDNYIIAGIENMLKKEGKDPQCNDITIALWLKDDKRYADINLTLLSYTQAVEKLQQRPFIWRIYTKNGIKETLKAP